MLEQQFWKKWTSEGSSEVVTQIKKGSYIDPLVMRFSPKSEFIVGNFQQNFSFLVKPYFLFLQYRKSVLKKTQIFGPLFEPCSSCVAVDFFSEKRRFLENRDPPKGTFLDKVYSFLSKCPNVNFFWSKRPNLAGFQAIRLGHAPPLPSSPPPPSPVTGVTLHNKKSVSRLTRQGTQRNDDARGKAMTRTNEVPK